MGRFSFGHILLFGHGLFGRGSFVRIVAVLSGLLIASFVTFASFPSAGFRVFTPPPSVDRTLKGDRLPLDPSAEKAVAPSASQTLRDKIPIGCERAFSPISAPRLADIFRRCAA
jgi:hypothetical protein